MGFTIPEEKGLFYLNEKISAKYVCGCCIGWHPKPPKKSRYLKNNTKIEVSTWG